MDDAGPDFPSDALDVGTQGQKPVDQRTVGVTGAGMRRQSGRLVYHHQFGVLVDHGKGNVLRYGYGRTRRRHGHQHPVAGTDAVGRFHRGAVDQHVAAVNELAQAAAGEAQLQPCQVLVQA